MKKTHYTEAQITFALKLAPPSTAPALSLQ